MRKNSQNSNIRADYEPQFAKMEMDSWFDMNSPYDMKSVMHYSSYAFAQDIYKPVMLAKNGDEIETNIKYMTTIDAQQVATMYKCNNPDYFTQFRVY